MIVRSCESGTAAMEACRARDEHLTSESVDGELGGYGEDESWSENLEVRFKIAMFSRTGALSSHGPLACHDKG